MAAKAGARTMNCFVQVLVRVMKLYLDNRDVFIPHSNFLNCPHHLIGGPVYELATRILLEILTELLTTAFQ